MSDLNVSQAVELIRAGKNAEARKILMQALKENPRNESAWLWLVQTLPTDAMRKSALEQCLVYFPQSQKARLGLERLASRQEASQPPAAEADLPPTARLLSQEAPPEQAPASTADLPPVPRFKPEEPALVEPPGSPPPKPSTAPLVLKPFHPEVQEEPKSPSILSGLYPSKRDAEGQDEQADLRSGLSDEESGSNPIEASVKPQPVVPSLASPPELPQLDQAEAQPALEGPQPDQIQDLRQPEKRKLPRLTFRSSLRYVLIVFYAVVLFGGGYAVWQRYGPDITAWFKALPQTVMAVVSPKPAPTAVPLPTRRPAAGTPDPNATSPQPGLGEILFISERNGDSDLYINHLDGHDPALVLAAGTTTTLIADPAWSADGSQIAFARGEAQKTDLFTARPDGSAVTVLTNDHASNTHPSWAPDGDRIVFASARDGGQDLYIITLSTGAVKRLTEKAGKNYTPAWSPDGSRIAFVSDREGFLGLYLINPDGSGLVRLSKPTESVGNPAWSPDSQRLVFSGVSSKDRLLYVIGRDGKSENRITFSPGQDDHPAWSPDGAWIVFSAKRNKVENQTLYMVRSSGKGLYVLDSLPFLNRDPVWSLVIQK